MNNLNQLYTVGLWTVKAGDEKAFVDAWTGFARWTAHNHPGAGVGYLLQDSGDPRQFISFGPWKDAEQVKAWRELPEFKAFISKARGFCEDIQPRSLTVVASSEA